MTDWYYDEVEDIELEKYTEEEKHKQILKEVKATMILIAVVATWHIGFAFILDGIDVLVLGMPLWFFVSTIGAFVISVVGVVILLKTVFKDFELGDDADEKVDLEQIPGQVFIAEAEAAAKEGGEV